MGWVLYGLNSVGWVPYGLNSVGWVPYGLNSVGWVPYGLNSVGWVPYGLNSVGWIPCGLNPVGLNQLGWIPWVKYRVGWIPMEPFSSLWSFFTKGNSCKHEHDSSFKSSFRDLLPIYLSINFHITKTRKPKKADLIFVENFNSNKKEN